MVIDNRIAGYILIEILKKTSGVNLFFKNPANTQVYKLWFDGLIFETPLPVINKKIENIELIQDVGFKARTRLHYLGLNPWNYKQLIIKLSGSTAEYKSELICIFPDYEFSPLAN
ncbi:MAG: hypothetical protein QM541_12515 [Flavobacterium sp.]|nr:hypothetical protein [Flavobacterium sp.]